MTTSLISDAFDHHSWATLRLLDVCAELTPEQLASSVPGTYGSILDTLRHTVGADSGYLHVLSGGRRPMIDSDTMDLPALRAAALDNQVGWSGLLADDLDPDENVVRYRDDGTESHATRGVRLAQALHHGTDHRSQICTALTALGSEPPEIDAWAYGRDSGRARLIEPPTA